MRELKIALTIFAIVFLFAASIYLTSMYATGKTYLSSESSDWGSFGSYIGGVLTPISSLMASYLVYRSFSSNAHQQKLMTARETILRLDNLLERRLSTPFHKNISDTGNYKVTLKDVIYSISNGESHSTEASDKALLSLIHNVAILSNSIRHYIGLLRETPSSAKDEHWLGSLEQQYWIEKYSAIFSRTIKIVGEKKLE